ncbi:MAG: glycosyltransferase [Magnetospirillum sp.]|nr:glycosyltransferase [Magnetospirillum sp.]
MRIFLANPNLYSYGGHDFGYLDCLRQPLTSAGHEVRVLGCQRMNPDLGSREGVLPAFSVPLPQAALEVYGTELVQQKTYYTMVTELFRTVPDSAEARDVRDFALRRYADWYAAWVVDATMKDLDRIDAEYSLAASDLFLFDHLHQEHIAALAEWAAYRLRRMDRSRIPSFAIVLHPALPGNDQGPPVRQAYADAFALIGEAGLVDRFHVFADTDRLAADYSALAGIPVATLPIPHAAPHVAVAERPDGGRPTIAFVGVSHRGHGFDLLPHVVERFSGLVAAGGLRFEIQAQVGASPHPSVTEALAALRRMPVTLHEGQLSAEAFYGIIARADICLLPYMGAWFRSQSSGVFAEVLAFGKVPIVSAGTWMADIVQRHDVGVVFPPSSLEDFYAAIERALADLDALGRRCRDFAEDWRRINSPQNYLDVLGRRIGGTSLRDPAFAMGPP